MSRRLQLGALKFSALRLSAVLLALVGGCGALLDGPPANRCASDADCAMATCDTSLGMCVANAETTIRIGLEVRPLTEPYGGSVQPVTFAPFDIEGPATRDLSLTPGVVMTGIVRDADGAPVGAELSFTRAGEIPGGPSNTVVVASSGTNPPRVDSGMAVGFATQLLAEQRFALTVRPTGEWASRLPPLDLPWASPSPGGGRIEIDYPRPCADPSTETDCLAVLEGQITDSAGAGQAGVVVKLIERTTGRTISSRYVTATDAGLDPGFFRVFFPVEFWRSTDAWFLRVSPAANRVADLGPSPTFTRTAESLAETDGIITVLTADVDQLRITYSGTVENEDSQPLVDAAIRFTSNDVTFPDTNFIGSYTATARTDERGHFSVELLGHPDAPATYDIVVTPNQLEDDLGLLRVERRLGADANGQLFTVPARARFGGTVQTVDGMRMLDARVDAQARGSDDDGSLTAAAFLARSNQTVTDPMGLFDLRLDVGFYDLVIEPPTGTGFPWLIQRDVAIGGSEAPLTSIYELDHPLPLSGRVTWDVDGVAMPMAEGEIRAYAVVESDAGTRAILVGRATSDADGRYRLLLPPSI